MSTARERAAENATEIASTVVLGLGFLALFTGFTPVPFWLIWAIGFTVIVPLVAILAGEEKAEDDWMGEWADWFDWSGRREHRHDGQSERQAGDGTIRPPTRSKPSATATRVVTSRTNSSSANSTRCSKQTARKTPPNGAPASASGAKRSCELPSHNRLDHPSRALGDAADGFEA